MGKTGNLNNPPSLVTGRPMAVCPVLRAGHPRKSARLREAPVVSGPIDQMSVAQRISKSATTMMNDTNRTPTPIAKINNRCSPEIPTMLR